MDFYENISNKLKHLMEGNDIADEPVTIVSARPLSPPEVIGTPERRDFPLLRGREAMVEATFKESRGQAYTDMPGDYQGLLREVLSLPMTDNFNRSVLIATLNAVAHHFGLIAGTVHCRDKEPGMCARQLPAFVREFGTSPKVALVGLQPAMAEQLAGAFTLRIVDLDEENIGKDKFGVLVEGPERTDDILSWGDLVLATGSVAVNGTIARVIQTKPVIFYGVTVAGTAHLLGYRRYCPFGH